MLIDFTLPQPFWHIDKYIESDNQNKILSHALRTPEERFKIYLAEKHIKIVWISVEEALLLDWTHLTERQVFHDSFAHFLNDLIKLSTAAQENLVLNNILKKQFILFKWLVIDISYFLFIKNKFENENFIGYIPLIILKMQKK